MKGLLLKDILVITKQLKIFLIVIPLMSLAGSSMAPLAILMGAVLPMTAIAYDERSKWNEIAVMMPYSKRDIVISKYLLGYICMIGSAALVIVVQLIRAIAGHGSFAESIPMLLFSISGGLIFIAINTPILFRFGSEKGRYVFIITVGLAAACGAFLKEIDAAFLLRISPVLPVFLCVAAVIMNVISMFLSKRIKIT
ncbi:MAG: ABC-2 transporter permease [Acetivibrio sp.]